MNVRQCYLKLVQETLPLLEEVPHLLASAEDAAFFRQALPKKNPSEPALKFPTMEAVAKLPDPGKSMILRPVASGGEAAMVHSTRPTPSGLGEEKGCKWPQKDDFTGAGSFATASIEPSVSLNPLIPPCTQLNVETETAQLPPIAKIPVEIKEKPAVKNIPSSSFFSLFSKIAPELALLKEAPDDAIAKKIALRWKTKNQTAPITLLTFSEPEPHRCFLENIAKALDVYFGPAKLVSAETIEKEKEWGVFLEAEGLKLIIVCDYTLWQLGNLMQFYKEVPNLSTRTLGKIPLFLLPDLSLYLKDPLLKRSLWKALCQKIL